MLAAGPGTARSPGPGATFVSHTSAVSMPLLMTTTAKSSLDKCESD